MKINIRFVDDSLAVNKDVSSYAREKIQSALKNTKQYIDEVNIRLMDLNGPKGGIDKLCSLQLSIPGQTPVHIKSRQGNVYAAISDAANRAAQKSQRRVRRRRLIASGGKLRRTGERPGGRVHSIFADYQNI